MPEVIFLKGTDGAAVRALAAFPKVHPAGSVPHGPTPPLCTTEAQTLLPESGRRPQVSHAGQTHITLRLLCVVEGQFSLYRNPKIADEDELDAREVGHDSELALGFSAEAHCRIGGRRLALGNRLTVGRQTLNLLVVVRIHVPQPSFIRTVTGSLMPTRLFL